MTLWFYIYMGYYNDDISRPTSRQKPTALNKRQGGVDQGQRSPMPHQTDPGNVACTAHLFESKDNI